MKANPDPYSNRPNIADDDSDPREILSQKFTTVERYANRAKVASVLTKAAERHNTSAEKILTSSKVFAIVVSQAGNEFTSESFRSRIHVAPLESKELAAAEPRGEIEDHHHAIGIIEIWRRTLRAS